MATLKLYVNLVRGLDSGKYFISVHKGAEDGPLMLFIETGTDREKAIHVLEKVCESLKDLGKVAYYPEYYRN
jgi:hypothetical protein